MTNSGPVNALVELSRWLREVADGHKDIGPGISGLRSLEVPAGTKTEALHHSLELDRIVVTLKERGL